MMMILEEHSNIKFHEIGMVRVQLKVKLTLEQAMNSPEGSAGTALLFL